MRAGKDKKGTTSENRPGRRGYPLFVRLPEETGKLLTSFLCSQRPRLSRTDLIKVAIEDYIAGTGFAMPAPTEESSK